MIFFVSSSISFLAKFLFLFSFPLLLSYYLYLPVFGTGEIKEFHSICQNIYEYIEIGNNGSLCSMMNRAIKVTRNQNAKTGNGND